MKIVHSIYLSDSEKKDSPFENTLLLNALTDGSKSVFEYIYSRFWDRMYLVAYNRIKTNRAYL